MKNNADALDRRVFKPVLTPGSCDRKRELLSRMPKTTVNALLKERFGLGFRAEGLTRNPVQPCKTPQDSRDLASGHQELPGAATCTITAGGYIMRLQVQLSILFFPV